MRIDLAGVALLMLSSMIGPSTAFGARIDLAPNQADPGGTAEMCAFLSANAEAVALQMDLQWDSRCVSPMLTSSGSPECTANSATGKALVAAVQDQRTRIIMVSLAKQDVIPNGQIFCCTFNVSQIPPSATCPFAFSGVSGANENGGKLSGIVAQGASLSIRQTDDAAAQPPGAAAAPPLAGGGITIPAANQPGNSAPQPKAVGNQPAPTAGAAAFAGFPRTTPGEENAGGGTGSQAFPAASGEDGQPDQEQSPTIGNKRETPRTTPTAATPTARPESTRTTQPGTSTPAAGTPTPAK